MLNKIYAFLLCTCLVAAEITNESPLSMPTQEFIETKEVIDIPEISEPVVEEKADVIALKFTKITKPAIGSAPTTEEVEEVEEEVIEKPDIEESIEKHPVYKLADHIESTYGIDLEPKVHDRRTVTDEEYQLLLRVCMSESGGKYGEPLEGKVAVVETILNRVDMYDSTITDVITQPYQYSMGDNGEPDETVVEAVEIALCGDTYPDNMLYFRTDYYHSFGTPYAQIGAHYFSLK